MFSFQGCKQLVKFLLCEIQDIYMSVIILPSMNVMRCTTIEKSWAQINCPFKIYVICRHHGNRGNTYISSHNMRSFIQAHNPTKFEVHHLSTLENPIFEFNVPLIPQIRVMKNYSNGDVSKVCKYSIRERESKVSIYFKLYLKKKIKCSYLTAHN